MFENFTMQFHNGIVYLYFTHLKRRVHKQSIESLVFTYIILAIQLLVFWTPRRELEILMMEEIVEEANNNLSWCEVPKNNFVFLLALAKDKQ